MTISVFTGTIDLVQRDPSGYTRFSGITPSFVGLGTFHARVLYIVTAPELRAMTSPVSRITKQELTDFVEGRLTSAQIAARIKVRDGQMFNIWETVQPTTMSAAPTWWQRFAASGGLFGVLLRWAIRLSMRDRAGFR